MRLLDNPLNKDALEHSFNHLPVLCMANEIFKKKVDRQFVKSNLKRKIRPVLVLQQSCFTKAVPPKIDAPSFLF